MKNESTGTRNENNRKKLYTIEVVEGMGSIKWKEKNGKQKAMENKSTGIRNGNNRKK